MLPALALVPAVLVVVAGALAVGYWVYLDAAARGSEAPAEWAVVCALAAPFALAYLAYRHRIGRHPGAGRRQRAAGTLAVGVATGLILAATLSPPDPFTQLLALPAATLVGVLPGTRSSGAGARIEFGERSPAPEYRR